MAKGFQKRKVRNNKLDYLKDKLFGRPKSQLTNNLISVGLVSLLLASFAIAAPDQQPPNGDIKPNFDGLNITSEGNGVVNHLTIDTNQAIRLATDLVDPNPEVTNWAQLNLGTLASVLEHEELLEVRSGQNKLRIDGDDNAIELIAPSVTIDGDLEVDGDLKFDGVTGRLIPVDSFVSGIVVPDQFANSPREGSLTVTCPFGSFVMSCGHSIGSAISGSGWSVDKSTSASGRSCNLEYSIAPGAESPGITNTFHGMALCYRSY